MGIQQESPYKENRDKKGNGRAEILKGSGQGRALTVSIDSVFGFRFNVMVSLCWRLRVFEFEFECIFGLDSIFNDNGEVFIVQHRVVWPARQCVGVKDCEKNELRCGELATYLYR